MAFTMITTVANQASAARLGVNNISLTEWDTTNLPSVTAGSTIQISNAMFNFTGDETCDTGGVIAGGANSTIYYLYANPTLKTCQGSATAPVWDDALQGFYQTLSGVYCRCYGSLYKNSVGAYERKVIANLGRNSFELEISYRKIQTNSTFDINLTGDVDIFKYDATGVLLTSKSRVAATEGIGVSYKEFYLKKPISAYFKIDMTAGTGTTNGYGYLQIKQNSAWSSIYGYDTKAAAWGYRVSITNPETRYLYSLNMNPGHYRIVAEIHSIYNNSTLTNYLYCTGVYGNSLLNTAADIITEV